jgi:hypothetical protein
MLTVLGEVPAVAATSVGTPGTVTPSAFAAFELDPPNAVEESLTTPASSMSPNERPASMSTGKVLVSTLAGASASAAPPLDDEQPAKIASARMNPV